MNEILDVVNSQMDALGLNYEFERMTESPPKYPYWVGEYSESEPITEDGEENIPFILTGFSRGEKVKFENQKSIIKDHFLHGVSVITETGASVVIYYGGMLPTPLEEGDLKKCQITLKIKSWKGQ